MVRSTVAELIIQKTSMILFFELHANDYSPFGRVRYGFPSCLGSSLGQADDRRRTWCGTSHLVAAQGTSVQIFEQIYWDYGTTCRQHMAYEIDTSMYYRSRCIFALLQSFRRNGSLKYIPEVQCSTIKRHYGFIVLVPDTKFYRRSSWFA